MSVRVYFLSPPLLKLKPVAKWKEVVIINSLPHTQKNQSSPLDKQTERERKCVCVCACLYEHTHIYGNNWFFTFQTICFETGTF